MSYQCRHFFVDSNSSQGYVNLISSNTAGLERFERLTGYPQKFVARIYDRMKEIAKRETMELQVIHDCISNEVQGALLPDIGYGFWNIPLYRTDIRHVSGMMWGEYLDEIRKNLGFAYDRFAAALKIHDDWEKVYISATDFEKLNGLTAETAAKLIGNRTLEKSGNEIHRFFGAATARGSFDYIPGLTEDIHKRYFIKGRPGTGKSTFLKKIASAALKQGYDAEIYHCAFDPNSWDMVIFRELDICLFDSTAPHEYFPDRPEDEIIDVYETCVKQGTDEVYAEKLAEFQRDYKNSVGQATSFLQLVNRIYSDLMLRVQLQIPSEKLEAECEHILSKL